MRTLRVFLAGTVILMLLGGLSGVVLAQDEAGKSDPATEATVEVLSDVGVIPLEAIPGDVDHVTYARISAEPGVSGQVGSAQPQEWANLEYTQSGTISSTWDTPVRVWQLDGSVVDYPAGTPQESHAGEVALFYNGGAAVVFENSGPDEAVSFFVGVGNSRNQETPQVGPPGSEWRHLDYVFPPQETAEHWFSAPVAVSYERITWEPGAQLVLGSDEVPMLSFIWLESGSLQYGEVLADEAAETDLVRTLVAGTTWRGQAPPEDTVYVLRNESDEPAIAIGVTLSHASEAGPIATAASATEEPTAAEAASILFVGNSFSFWDDGVWTHVAGLAASEDPPRTIDVDSITAGGAPLRSFVSRVSAERVRDRGSDVVVLQGDIPENADPENAVETFLESARTLDQAVRDGGARPVYYMTWPFILADWMGHAGIEAAHRQIEDELDATVAPVAMAMIDSLIERPELDMLGPDMSHPSDHGLYLAAAVIYATIYGQSPEGLGYRPDGVSDEEAAYLQRVAWQAIEAWEDGAMSPAPDAGAWVTGSISPCTPDWSAPPRVTFHDGIWAISGLTMTCRDTASDPRVTGRATTVWHCDCQYGVGSPTWGTYELEGPDGSWIGPRYGTRAMDGSGHSFAVLEGTGAYEGLTYMVDWTHEPNGMTELEGVIFEGAPPEPAE